MRAPYDSNFHRFPETVCRLFLTRSFSHFFHVVVSHIIHYFTGESHNPFQSGDELQGPCDPEGKEKEPGDESGYGQGPAVRVGIEVRIPQDPPDEDHMDQIDPEGAAVHLQNCPADRAAAFEAYGIKNGDRKSYYSLIFCVIKILVYICKRERGLLSS